MSAAADLKRKSSKPQGPEYEYFEIISKRGEGKCGYRVRCKFCNGTEMNSHAPRMRKHLVFKCNGGVPDEVKNKFKEHKVVYTRSESAPARKKPRRHGEDTDGSDEDEDSLIDDDSRFRGENESAVNMIHPFITSYHSSDLKVPKKSSDETTHGKKPVKTLTDADFDREQKELLTKKMRLEVKIMEDQRKFWSSLSGNVDKLIRAVDIYIEKSARENNNETHTIPVMYTANPDGTLQAYNQCDSINPSSILGSVNNGTMVTGSSQEDD